MSGWQVVIGQWLAGGNRPVAGAGIGREPGRLGNRVGTEGSVRSQVRWRVLEFQSGNIAIEGACHFFRECSQLLPTLVINPAIK